MARLTRRRSGRCLQLQPRDSDHHLEGHQQRARAFTQVGRFRRGAAHRRARRLPPVPPRVDHHAIRWLRPEQVERGGGVDLPATRAERAIRVRAAVDGLHRDQSLARPHRPVLGGSVWRLEHRCMVGHGAIVGARGATARPGGTSSEREDHRRIEDAVESRHLLRRRERRDPVVLLVESGLGLDAIAGSQRLGDARRRYRGRRAHLGEHGLVLDWR